ncbi:MAG TPA: MarR family transcriptional regulator, partial [Beijerinckiaceae bacterium]
MNRAGSLVIQLYSRDLAAWGLTVPMWRVLATLQERGPQRLIDLAVLTAIDVSTLSRTIGAMARKSFVTRSVAPDNRREVVISATKEGRAALARAVPVALAYEDDLVAGVPEADLAATKRTLTHVFARLMLRAGQAAPAPRD